MEYADRLGYQVYPIIQELFLKKDTISQDDNALIHTVGTVQSWHEVDEAELQHLTWPAQSPDFNIIEPIW
jgi:hypothetical protein